MTRTPRKLGLGSQGPQDFWYEGKPWGQLYKLWNLLQGLYQKAEALYYQGEFELALMFYHRGRKLRPELQEFRLGIQKAQEAIDNSVGSMLSSSVVIDKQIYTRVLIF